MHTFALLRHLHCFASRRSIGGPHKLQQPLDLLRDQIGAIPLDEVVGSFGNDGTATFVGLRQGCKTLIVGLPDGLEVLFNNPRDHPKLLQRDR